MSGEARRDGGVGHGPRGAAIVVTLGEPLHERVVLGQGLELVDASRAVEDDLLRDDDALAAVAAHVAGELQNAHVAVHDGGGAHLLQELHGGGPLVGGVLVQLDLDGVLVDDGVRAGQERQERAVDDGLSVDAGDRGLFAVPAGAGGQCYGDCGHCCPPFGLLISMGSCFGKRGLHETCGLRTNAKYILPQKIAVVNSTTAILYLLSYVCNASEHATEHVVLPAFLQASQIRIRSLQVGLAQFS